MFKKIILGVIIMFSQIAQASITLIDNTPIKFGQLMPKTGQCYIKYDKLSSGIIEGSQAAICTEKVGQAGTFVLLTGPGQDVSFTVTTPIPQSSDILNLVDFRIEGVAYNDMGTQRLVLADNPVTINSGNSGRITVDLGGLLNVKGNLSFNNQYRLTYKILY